MAIDWAKAAYTIEFPLLAAYEAEKQRKVAALLHAPAAPSESSAPTPGANEPVRRASQPVERSARTAPTVGRVVKHYRDPAVVLSDALEAARDDGERAALLVAAPQQVRDRLSALLTYRRFVSGADAPDPDAPFAELTRALDAAPDDNARLAVITAARQDPKRGSAFLREWRWRRTATSDGWRKRYLAEVAGDGEG
jgi:hypothetical protein